MTEKQLEKKMLYLIDDILKSPMYKTKNEVIVELTKECVELTKEYHNINKRNYIIDGVIGSK